ncbi:Mitochondrial 2-oxodicarboxylate carrier-like [Homarus americanus]|uniref:Mitochondrial 2-oxodicarboxylate carrier n=1 Tax=Homarus americanus TaxID=6706 RepID=A0A8J5JMM8_HOMAM|nr:Mitochondrial 2-oxodicarboxylate carrier-like [Homarus americanus]
MNGGELALKKKKGTVFRPSWDIKTEGQCQEELHLHLKDLHSVFGGSHDWRCLKFLTFEIYKQLFGGPSPTTFFLAGLGSGTTEAILVNPFEVVKVTQQANRAQHKVSPSTWAVAREIIRTQGLGFRGLNKGVTATIGRNGLFNMVKWQQNLQKFFIGLVAGVLGCLINIPFDVAKSHPRATASPGRDQVPLNICLHCSFRALYKGLVPKVLRLGPGAGIMMIVYENVHGYLVKRFPDD